MKETKRLYFDDPYQTEFEAQVIEHFEQERKIVLVLDQTCFYPESGGQPADKGTLNGVEVADVKEEDSKILHFLERDIAATGVRGKIHWEIRFDHMQQHTGQHILSQSFYELLRAETLSFHLGEKTSTVEIGVERISERDAERVELRANEVVFEDRPVKTYFLSEDELEKIPLRKPPEKIGSIRVVEVNGFDYSACGGTHCRRTGEVGMIKITKWERIRNNLRFEFVCGKRALRDYALKNILLHRLSLRFSAGEERLESSVENLFSELKSLRKTIKNLEEKIIHYEAAEIVQKAEGKIIEKIFERRPLEEVKFLALQIIRSGDFIVLFGLKGEARNHLVLARSESFSFDWREIVPSLCDLLRGKGGGSPSLVEMAAEKETDIRPALAKALDFVHYKC